MPEKSKTYEKSAPRVYIRTFGCQMNDRDSEALLGLFIDQGYAAVDNPEDADVILVNTCSVRANAENRAISFLGSLRKDTRTQGHKDTRKKNKNALRVTHYAQRIVGLIGCMARNRGEDILKRMPHVDLVVGPANFAKIPEYVGKVREQGIRVINLDDDQRSEALYHPLYRLETEKAQVVISTGCDNYCSYCVVPFVRGKLRPRAPEDIIGEVKRNIGLGIRKITLLGQNVNDYSYKSQVENLRSTQYSVRSTNTGFVDLLKMVADLKGLEEVEFITSHPKNTSRELFKLMAESPKIKKHLHLPFQSGSNRILKLMNRGYTREEYLKLVYDYKDITGGRLSTDAIVGFPTETEEDFLQTKDVLEKARPKYAFIFKYSSRPDTKALSLSDDLAEEEKAKRHKILLDLQRKISKSSV